jgi:hypothetical protein
MRIHIDHVKRVSSIALEVMLGVVLLAIVVTAWNGAGIRAGAEASPSPRNKPTITVEASLLAIQGTCVSPPPNMISWWTGDGTAADLQDGNDGTLVNGATFAPGMVGQAFSLDGVDDRVDVSDSDNLDVPSQITIDAWINPAALGGRVVDKITAGKGDGYLLDTFGGNVRFVFGSQEVSGSTTLATNEFTHVAATYDFTTLNVYVNGVLDGTLLAEELSLSPNGLPLRIGADQTGANPFSGLIDEVEIFNRALSEAEIQSIVAAGGAGKCKDTCVLTCPSDITQQNDVGLCGAVVNFTPSSSACGSVTCAPPAGSFFNVGSTTVTCTAAAGPTCSFNVTVTDSDPPILDSCPKSINASTEDKCIVINYTTPTATDNCGTASVTCTPPSGFCFPVGTTTVTCVASDSSPDSADAECTFTVTVDSCPISCPANIVVANDANQCGAVVNFSATAPKACGMVICSPPSGSFFPVGTTTVACSTEMGGNCGFTVTVNDTQPPALTCPANIIVVGTVATYPPPTASDNCPGVTATCTPASGSTFPAGTTTVTCTATDASGNTAACSFGVTTFDLCLQDDSDVTRVLMFSSVSGDYIFCCGQFTVSGKGTIVKQGGNITLQHNTSDRRVLGKFSTSSKSGSASVQSPPGVIKCTITDRDTRNNSCSCGA